ncbi:MAG: J domain-containing protein [Bryobacteraceae bacterium]
MNSDFSQTRQRIRNLLDAQEITVILDSVGGPHSRLKARFVAQTPTQLRIHMETALGAGVILGVAGEIESAAGRLPLLGQYQVKSCVLAGTGKYLVELTPLSDDAPTAEAVPSADIDYYEVLQVSRRADIDTIHRVFHVLAQRYHPDNRDTGDINVFRQLAEAHTVLCDRERRAAYDVRLAAEDKTRLRIFESLESTDGVQAEVRKRQGILRLLYGKRMTEPNDPALRARDFAEMLSCPLEHLEFSLWFLRDKRLIIRSDNNRFEITSLGVETFEATEPNFSRRGYLRLPSPVNERRDRPQDSTRAAAL